MSLMHGFEDKSSQQQWRSEFHAYYCCGANKGQGWANPMQEEEQEKFNYDFNQVGVRTGIMQLSITSHWICTWVAQKTFERVDSDFRCGLTSHCVDTSQLSFYGSGPVSSGSIGPHIPSGNLT